MRWLVLALTCLSAACAQTRGEGDRRVALVIGNAAYQAGTKLVNPANDAKAIELRLKQLRFDVTLRLDATQQQMDAAIREFTEKLGPGAVAVFFYAGHGFQLDGINYLLPVDFARRGSDEQSVKYASLAADELLDRIEAARPRISLLILDACRNNPFIARRSRSAVNGLAPMTPASGAAIMFATDAGKTADDNPRERNGMFTKHLLAALEEPGLSLGEISESVTERVLNATNGEQNPAYVSKVGGRFVFNPGMRSAGVRSEGAGEATQHGPEIKMLTPDRSDVEPNQTVQLRAAATDPGGDALQYAWSATSGRIEARGDTAVYSAGPPGSIPVGSDIVITVKARNSRGLETSKDLFLKLSAPAPVSPTTVLGRAIPIGASTDVVLEAQQGTGAVSAGVIEARLEFVDGVWQVIRVEGSYPGTAIDAAVECLNGTVVAFVEQPSESNQYLRARVRIQPAGQPSITLRLRFQPAAGKISKKKR